jgi:phosphatidylserine decarboxylase
MRRPLIAKEGLPYIIGLALLSLVFAILGWGIPAGLTFIGLILVVNFFRDPERTTPHVPDAVVAPADGRVIYVGKVFEDRFLDREALKISIFMSIFDVHVNRIPFSGEVESVHYEKGTFFSANLDKASQDNEHNAVVLSIPGGERMVFIQIAGLVARRIDCWLQPGNQVQRGERFGLIRFGSRLDLFVPVGCRPAVREGHRVKAGESIVCYNPSKSKNGVEQNPDR